MYLIPQDDKLMDAVPFPYGLRLRDASVSRQHLSTIFYFPTVPLVSQPSITVNSQGGGSGHSGYLSSTTKQVKNEEIQCVNWAYYTKKDWDDESSSEERL